jgi:hypothetical protein
MARTDPVDRNLLRMELRRFQTRCEAIEGSIRRADTIRAVVRLAKIAIPFALIEESEALDTRAQVRRTAETKARELLETQFSLLGRAEPMARDKIRRGLDDEIQQLNGPLNPLRIWAQSRLLVVEQGLARNG